VKVLVYNTDGVNPYATEISALLSARGAEVVLIDAASGEHRPPPAVRWRRCLPANFSGSPAQQAVRLVRGLASTAWASLVRGHVVVVAFARFPVESLAFAALAALGRPVVVVLHNPVSRREESSFMGIARRLLLARAAAVVIHAERLRKAVERVAADRVLVCPHPPYHHTAVPDPGHGRPEEDGRRWVAFVGALRWDKGIELLPEVLERVPEDERERIGVVVCGMGTAPEGMFSRLRQLGYAVRDLTSSEPIPQEQLLGVLAPQPLVLAPYVAATQSGSVILALTMGCRVVAFDEGGIPDVLDADGLVPSGDLDAMAKAVAEDRGGRGVLEVDAWLEQATDCWFRTISEAGRVRRALTTVPRGRLMARGLVQRVAQRSPYGSKVLVRLDRRARTGRAVRFEELVDEVLQLRPDVVSIDVFDTVLTRRVVATEDVWWIAGARLAERTGDAELAERYVAARTRAAADLPHAPLGELVRHPAFDGFPPGAADVEAEVEATLFRAVPGAVDGLRRLREGGVALAFVTDMHLGRRDLWNALVDRGLATEADQLVISSEVGKSKARGGLFAELGPDRQRVVHLGNDLWSDVAMAEAEGVRGLAIASAEPNRAEARMAQRRGSVGTAVAAASRLARLRQTSADPLDAALVETGALAGQCFGAFLLWARDQCATEGITDVGFLARDGELPLRMAEAMPDDHWDGCHLRYVELASRRAWSVAAAASLGMDAWMAIGDADERAFINTSRHLVPFRSLLERIALRPEDLHRHADLAALDPEAPLPPRAVSAWSALLADQDIRATILERAHEARGLLIEYLHGLDLGDRRLALIDVGWRGQLAWMMSAVLRDITGAEPLHLHFGGANVARGLQGEVDIRRFAVDDTVEPLPFPDMVSCVETFTASGRARALGLERGPTGEVEIVEGAGVPDVANAARSRLWSTAIESAALLPSRAELDGWQLDGSTLATEVRDILTAFWTDPEPVHAMAAAQLGFEVDDAGTVVGPVAARYRLSEFIGDRAAAPRQWRQGSLRLTPPLQRTAFRSLLGLRDRIRG
jgi:glycosyltransferase involved in cell wall biosynthesis/FMN phosphatase YigB (HAD superfamily)